MEVIGHLVKVLGVYREVPALVDALVKRHGLVAVEDLCSGSGIPAMYIQQRLSASLPFLLTDKYPQQIHAQPLVRYAAESVDIFDLVPEKDKLYTLYNAFHHFNDVEKKTIIARFKRCNAKLLIVEILTPNLWSLIQVTFASLVLQILIAPFIKPFSWVRLLLTYVLPINLLTVWVDGIISVFKSRTKMQYDDLFHELNDSTYAVETVSFFSFPTQLIVIQANPLDESA